MKLAHFSPLMFLLFLFSANANAEGSLLRVTCEGDDAGAEVTINGKYEGDCPVDIQLKEGSYKLLVEKKSPTSERVFEQYVRMGDGVVKKVAAVLFESIKMVSIPGKNYEMGKFEVTQGQWRAVMGNNPSHFSNCGDSCPVENVSWNDMQEFLQKLNAKTGKQYRLPTDAEWEYACYGGSQTKYCGSNDIKAVAWYGDISGGITHPVGQKQANGYGLYDMSGNVSELMESWYDSSKTEYGRAIRGGSWFDAQTFSAAIRLFIGPPTFRDSYYGFRIARMFP